MASPAVTSTWHKVRYRYAQSPPWVTDRQQSTIVRTTRARVIRLKNDLTAVMAKIEPALHELFAKARESGTDAPPIPNGTRSGQTGTSAGGAAASTQGATSTLTLRPFAKVNSVVAGSPADHAGLRAGDEVLRFGDVDWTKQDKLAKVAATTGRSEGVRHL